MRPHYVDLNYEKVSYTVFNIECATAQRTRHCKYCKDKLYVCQDIGRYKYYIKKRKRTLHKKYFMTGENIFMVLYRLSHYTYAANLICSR